MKKKKDDILEQSVITAIEGIKAGRIVVIPTDTVYGMAVLPDSESAVSALRIAKGRDADKPIALLASGIDAIKRFGVEMNKYEQALAEQFWPGALTMVMRIGTGKMEGFRIPDLEITRYIIDRCGGVLRVTSANMSGESPAVTAEMAKELLKDRGVYTFVDAGPVKGGIASTVVSVNDEGEINVFREGAIPAEKIKMICKNTDQA